MLRLLNVRFDLSVTSGLSRNNMERLNVSLARLTLEKNAFFWRGGMKFCYIILFFFTPSEARPLNVYPHGMVVADNAEAAEVGAELLRRGGDAVDAAVGTALALGVVHAFGSGIGGGGFALVHRHDNKAFALDFREVAPVQAHSRMFLNEQGEVLQGLSRTGALAVAVPGELAGLCELHKRHGKLSFAKVVEPAIKLAYDGFTVTPILHKKLKEAYVDLRTSVLAPYLVDASKAIRKPGMKMRLPPLGKTLKVIAEQGCDAFYRGVLRDEMVRAITAHGGIITAKDLEQYRPKERQILRGRFFNFDILTMPLPSSGGLVLLQVLRALENVGVSGLKPGRVGYLHRLIEFFKHGFADRAQAMGDPDFVEFDAGSMLSEARLRVIEQRFNPEKTLTQDAYGGANHIGEDDGTTHLNVVDRKGNAVALTSTINTGFGSRFVAGKTGIVLNNQMDDFVARPGVPNAFGLIGQQSNAIAANKRPLSSMTPTIVRRDGRVVLVIGASGGPWIISSTVQVLLNVLLFKMLPKQAVSEPRLHHQWFPNRVFVDPGIHKTQRDELRSKGHTVEEKVRFAATQVIANFNGELLGAADPSKGGAAVTAQD